MKAPPEVFCTRASLWPSAVNASCRALSLILALSNAIVIVAPLLNSIPALRAGGTISEMTPGTKSALERRK